MTDSFPIGIVGAGVMGRGIAAACLEAGFDVILTDTDADVLDAAAAELAGNTPAADRLKTVQADKSTDALAAAGLIIESVVETARVKKRVLAGLESVVCETAIVGTNTSSIPVDLLAASLQQRGRFCGLHFCHPVCDRRLVEVVRGPQTTESTIQHAVQFATRLGKIPIVVLDSPGFVLNRLLLPYLNEALELLLDGAEPGVIESTAMSLGMPMGPLAMFDSFGIDVIVRTGAVLQRSWPDRPFQSGLLLDLYSEGRLGRKTGSGFFAYDNKIQSSDLDPATAALIARHRRAHRPPSDHDIAERLQLSLILEATRVLSEGIVPHAADIDTALRHGVNFQPTVAGSPGLLARADAQGAERIVARLESLKSTAHRFRPTPLLLQLAERNGSLFSHRIRPAA